eukprot:2430453-Alexandrium_andersonii.AAC.1
MLRLAIYVDDPVYVAGGALRDRARECAVALLWATLVGYPLAWRKTTSGPAVVWVSACLEFTAEGVRVTIPEKKLHE